VTSSTTLGMIIGSVGMASNLAALRALATDGIQRGHMALHRRATGSMRRVEDPVSSGPAPVIGSRP